VSGNRTPSHQKLGIARKDNRSSRKEIEAT
jgi:hypothetical protein